jgi:hypothetical protein
LLLLSAVLPYAYFATTWQSELREAVAEADRLEPDGWRLQDVERQRATVPDEQNSALILANVKQLLPPKWPFWDVTQDSPLPAEEREALQKSLEDPDPPVQLDARQTKALGDELKRAAQALALARKGSALQRGRYPIVYTRDFISTRLPYTQDTRTVARLLAFNALLRAQEGDLDGALASCRWMFGAGRSVGDEPTLISMLVRIAVHHYGARKVERVLAQGEPSEAALVALQHLLEEEVREPLLLLGLRGERGGMDALMEAIQNGDVNLWQLAQLASGPRASLISLEGLKMVAMAGSVKHSRAVQLRYMNRIVEYAKRPLIEQPALFKQADEEVKRLPGLARMLCPAASKVAEAFHRDQALLECTILLVAAERYRRARGHWPETVNELVPAFATAVPADPFDGKPLRLVRRPDGLVVYSVGVDGVDNGGNLDRNPRTQGTDWGVQLWDVGGRRQAPARSAAKETASPVSPGEVK